MIGHVCCMTENDYENKVMMQMLYGVHGALNSRASFF
jgi:hypothetical protein